MVIIPVVPAPSRRTRELKEKLELAIRDYERDHPNLSAAEIQLALQMMSAADARPGNRKAAGVIAGLALFLGGGIAFYARGGAAGGAGGAGGAPWIGIAVVALLIAFLAMALIRRNN